MAFLKKLGIWIISILLSICIFTLIFGTFTNIDIKEAFGDDTIKSYLKLKKSEINNFNQEEKFNKKNPITNWEKNSTLDC